MNKFLLMFTSLILLSSCAYQSQSHVDQMAQERERSFFFESNAVDGFKGMYCENQGEVLLDIAKTQISAQEDLDVFSKMLTMEYLDLANYEYYEMGDELDGEYLFTKAVKASQGGYPLLENLEDWRVSRKNFEALKWGREDFMSLVYSEGLIKDPINMAKAQVAYDCWVEQQAEGTNDLHTRVCKKEFNDRISKSYSILNGEPSEEYIDDMLRGFKLDENVNYLDLDELEGIYKVIEVVEEATMVEDVIVEGNLSLIAEEISPLADDEYLMMLSKELNVPVEILAKDGSLLNPEELGVPVEILAKDESSLKVERLDDNLYNVYFDWNFTRPKNGDKEKIKQIADSFLASDYTLIILKAYTDRSGTEEVNKIISIKRGKTVKDMLTKEGVEKSLISFFAFGEAVTPDPDGVKNEEYRKVIVTFE